MRSIFQLPKHRVPKSSMLLEMMVARMVSPSLTDTEFMLVYSSKSANSGSDVHEQTIKQSDCARFFAQDPAGVPEFGWICHGSCLWLGAQGQGRPSFETDQILSHRSLPCFATQEVLCLQPFACQAAWQTFQTYQPFAPEQVFSWFRNYARLLNEARPLRHSFKVLYFVNCQLSSCTIWLFVPKGQPTSTSTRACPGGLRRAMPASRPASPSRANRPRLWRSEPRLAALSVTHSNVLLWSPLDTSTAWTCCQK